MHSIQALRGETLKQRQPVMLIFLHCSKLRWQEEDIRECCSEHTR